MNALSSRRFLAIYSGVLTLVFVVTVFWGFLRIRNPNFNMMTARRINNRAGWNGAINDLEPGRFSGWLDSQERVRQAGPPRRRRDVIHE